MARQGNGSMSNGDKVCPGKQRGQKGGDLGGGAILYKEIGKSLPGKLTSDRDHEERGCHVAIWGRGEALLAEGTARQRRISGRVLGTLEAR